MSDLPKNLTRNQLAEFLPNQRAVRMFEMLLKQVNTLLPTDIETLQRLIQESSIDAAAADAKATQVLSSLNRIADALERLALAPGLTIQSQSSDNLAPSVQMGTVAQQNSDNVSIKGGSVTANLTNNQTTLLKSSTTLSNAAAAAVATLTNAPVAGNPTKWVSIDDNGTTRRIPTW